MSNEMGSRSPFAAVPFWVLEKEEIKTGHTLHVYAALCLLANFKKRITDGNWEKISDWTGLKRTAIYDALKTLRDARIIFALKDGTYWIPLDDPSAVADLQSVYTDFSSADADPSIYTENYSEESEVTHKNLKEYPTIVHELCEQLQRRVGAHKGHKPKITDTWLRDMDLLLRRGGGGWDEPQSIDPFTVGDMINAVFDKLSVRGARGFCWADNIQSPGSLREKWDRLSLDLDAIRLIGRPTTPIQSDEDRLEQIREAWRIHEADPSALWPWPGNAEGRTLRGCPSDYGFERPA